ncbi:MAG TPA: hypothetical protein DCR10_02590, partial [Acidimicrobiaceae bacterium]|nr:hypothetical protein [Acidimicrobiaceae bacterium]
MNVQFSAARRMPARAEVIAHGLTLEDFEGGEDLPTELGRDDLGRLGFEGKAGQVQVVPCGGRLLAAVGLGSATEISTNVLRRSAANLARAVRKRRSVALDLASVAARNGGPAEADGVAAVVEGVELALYRFDYRSSGG